MSFCVFVYIEDRSIHRIHKRLFVYFRIDIDDPKKDKRPFVYLSVDLTRRCSQIHFCTKGLLCICPSSSLV